MTLIFGRLTCKVKKQDQQKQAAVIIREPITKSCLFPMVSDWEGCWFSGLTHGRFSAGPLVSDINMAPPTVTIVPSTLAWQFIFLISIFSSLNKPTQSYFNFHIKLYFCGNVFEQGFNYLKIQAIRKANAGIILHMADVKVAVVYFIPI